MTTTSTPRPARLARLARTPGLNGTDTTGGRRRNHRGHRRVAAFGLAAALMSACCPDPPVPPAPALPTGIGVEWVRDVGGTVDEFGIYRESYGRFRLLDGTTSGPVAVAQPYVPPIATLGPAYASFGLPVFPDGTAAFPWNGFAGEGVTTVVTTAPGSTTYDVTAPAGTCRFTNVSTTFATPKTTAAIPSPDGSKLATYTRLTDPDAGAIETTISIYEVGDPCVRLTSTTRRWSTYAGSITGEMILSPLTVWSPDSTAVLFAVGVAPTTTATRLTRLDAAPGATPTLVSDDPTSTVLPLGWSPGGRALIVRMTPATGTPPVASSSLETLPVAGGPIAGGSPTVFDVQTSAVPATRAEFHVGAFVPGTSTIVYSGGTRTVTNGDGRTVAWPELRLRDDATGGDAALAGAAAPLVWHPTPAGDMPNGEFVERFVR